MADVGQGGERGILIGPLRKEQSPDDLAKCIFQLLNCVGIRCADISRISVNPGGCYAKVVLHKKECEDYAVKVLRELRSVMSVYDLRRLTDKPKYLKVERISPSAFESMGLSDFSEYMLHKEQQRAQVKTIFTPMVEGEPFLAPNKFEETSREKFVEEQDLVFDIRSLTQTYSSSATPVGFDRLEEETTNSKLMDVIHVATSTSDLHQEKALHTREHKPPKEKKTMEPKPGMVHAKTSTPDMEHSFCTGRNFYHRLQLLQRDGNVHLDSGHIVRTNLRGFRQMIGKYVCAYLNSQGGTLYFGANEDGEVIGVPMKQRFEDALRLDIDQQVKLIRPIVLTSKYTVNFTSVMDQTGHLLPDLKVIEMCVKPSDLGEEKYVFDRTKYVIQNGRPQPYVRDTAV